MTHFFVKQFLLATLLLMGLTSFAQNSNMVLRSTQTYPDQTLANICGWTSPNGREYALIGASKGMVITEVTNPAAPVQIVQIPGPDNLWKEIKTYKQYAYITSEGGGGLQIVDLSALPSPNLVYHSYTGDGAIQGQLGKIHSLHIDTLAGYVYLHGSSLFQGGDVILDLKNDPYNPTYAGKFDGLGYVHDAYVDNDTLYACHIYSGLLSIVDMKDKQNPVVLGTVETPGKFTHNAWLTSDRHHILTTDETTPSFITSYDITDPSDPIELDRFSIDNGNGSLGHNVHMINDYAVTSWYTGGVVITDCHRPDNLVQVGQYDTWAGTGPGFDGCWGAYPYFPSGTIVASNIENPAQMFVLTPTYLRACYLEGVVTNGCDGSPLEGATVEIVGGVVSATTQTNSLGIAKTGQQLPGTFTIKISRPGFTTQTFSATLAPGEVSAFNVLLQPTSAYKVEGIVKNEMNESLANIPVVLSNNTETYQLVSDVTGYFSTDCVTAGTYSISAGTWGYYIENEVITVNAATTVQLVLKEGYFDNFNLDYGWEVSGTASTGAWERGEPVGTQFDNVASNPDVDENTDAGDQCYVTGNGGGAAANDDVDGGTAILTSPAMLLAGKEDALLTFAYWFFNNGGNSTPNDKFEVLVTNGTQTVPLLSTTVSESQWRQSGTIALADYITLNDQVRVIFSTADQAPGHLVEAAVDIVRIEPILISSTNAQPKLGKVRVTPNPSTADFLVQWTDNSTTSAVVGYEVLNGLGQVIMDGKIQSGSQNLRLGATLLPGVYTLVLRQEGIVNSMRLVKQ